MRRLGEARHAVDVEAELCGLVGASDDPGAVRVFGNAHAMSHVPPLSYHGDLGMIMKGS